MTVALDTNILAYAEGVNDPGRRAQAMAAIAEHGDDVVIPAQVLGELFNVLLRRGALSREAAADVVQRWMAAYRIEPTTAETIAAAAELAAQHKLATWDAVILAAAAQAGCRALLSQDMQHGFGWRGTVVRDPFRAR